MGAVDGLGIIKFDTTWDDYSCAPYVTPEVGKHYILLHNRLTRPVLVLGIFDELIVVRYNQPYETYMGMRREEAVLRQITSFLEIPTSGSEVATTADADTPVE